MMNDVVSIGSLVVAAAAAIWGIYQTRVTKALERELYRLNTSLDQSVQRLHRAHEAVIKEQQTLLFLLFYVPTVEEPDEVYASKRGELSSYQAELRGLAFAIGDEELLRLVNQHKEQYSSLSPEAQLEWKEMDIRLRAQQLHTRISQLLEESTETTA